MTKAPSIPTAWAAHAPRWPSGDVLSTTEAKRESLLAADDRRPRRALSSRRDGVDREWLIDLSVVAVPSLLALALCLYQITTRSLWLDESATVSIVSQHGAAFGAALAHDGGNMLAYYALLHVLVGWFGTGALVIRLPAAIAAAATVALLGTLALRLTDRRVALVVGVLSAVSLSLIYWGQDARGYIPMVALITASFIPLLSLLERRHRGGTAWIAYVVLMTAATYVGLQAVLVVAAQLVALVWFRDRWRAVVSAVATTAVCCIPLAVLAAERGSGQLFWVPKPNARVLYQVVQALTSSGLQPSFYTSTSIALLVVTVVVLLVGVGRTWRLAAAGSAGLPWQQGLMLSWLLVPAVVALVESAVGQSIFQARYLLVSLPAVSLLLAWTLADRGVVAAGRGPQLVSLGVLAALITLRALQLGPAYGASSENWRAATSYVIGRSSATDCIAFYPLDNRQAFRYYMRDFARAPRPILPTLPWRQVRPFIENYTSLSSAQVARLPERCGRVWVVASHEGRTGGPAISQANHARFARLTAELVRRYPAARTATFSPAGVVTVTLYSR